MPIILQEFIDVIIMTLVVGFIFMRLIDRTGKFKKGFFWFATLTIAPAIIFHELGHKLVAIFFGYTAIFHAAYFWLGIGVMLALMRSPFIFFVPAFVSITCSTTGCIQSPAVISLIAFAGPFVNLLFFIASYIVIKSKKDMSQKEFMFWHLTKNINLFLFIFNMLPIPGFDGSKVFGGLIQLFG